MTFSEKLAEPILTGVLVLELEPPPEPHAPATRAKATRLAPTAPTRRNRMGLLPSCRCCGRRFPPHLCRLTRQAPRPPCPRARRLRGGRMPGGVRREGGRAGAP